MTPNCTCCYCKETRARYERARRDNEAWMRARLSAHDAPTRREEWVLGALAAVLILTAVGVALSLSWTG